MEAALRELKRVHHVHIGRRPQTPHSASLHPLPLAAARAVPLDVVAEHLGLDLFRCGRELITHCPFHDDHDPSLRLNITKGLWYCFPCNLGGDGIALVMGLKNLTFAEAVRELGT